MNDLPVLNWDDVLSSEVRKIIPEGHTVAVVAIVNKAGEKVVAGVNLLHDKTLELQGYFTHDRIQHDKNYGVQLLWSK